MLETDYNFRATTSGFENGKNCVRDVARQVILNASIYKSRQQIRHGCLATSGTTEHSGLSDLNPVSEAGFRPACVAGVKKGERRGVQREE